jgi:group I intron endonuclease
MAKELDKGEIYLVRNIENKKCYVGQAKKYVSLNNFTWGTQGRWKSHIREALGGKKDHCLLLNQAIRKHGVDGFEVTKLCDCLLTEMDDLERQYIQQYNSLAPNGYNVTTGGTSNKRSVKLSDEKKERGKHSEKTKDNISQGQLGNRRGSKARKYEEDNDLPKYINAKREKRVVVGYIIGKFPIGVDKKKYISKSFSCASNPQSAYNDAIAYLEKLKEKYKDLQVQLEQTKTQKLNEEATEMRKSKLIDNLPQHVFPILDGKILKGYYVEGLIDKNNHPVPRKEFCLNLNHHNLRQATKFVETVKKA